MPESRISSITAGSVVRRGSGTPQAADALISCPVTVLGTDTRGCPGCSFLEQQVAAIGGLGDVLRDRVVWAEQPAAAP
jgi:hypothetical protein